VACSDCRLQFQPLSDEKVYKVQFVQVSGTTAFWWRQRKGRQRRHNMSHGDAQYLKPLAGGDAAGPLQVVMTEYVAGGGDGFAIIAQNKEKHLQVGSGEGGKSNNDVVGVSTRLLSQF
jgi:hypothetical protein